MSSTPPPARGSRASTAVLVVVAVAAPLVGIALLARALVGGDAPPPGPTPEAPWAVFASDADGEVVRWDGCAPVPWAFAPAGAPPGGRALVEEAVALLAEASGLDFVDVGDVDERPRADRPAVDETADGTRRWAPVLVGWVDHEGSDLGMRLQDRGLGLAVAVEGPSGRVYVTGQVALNRAWPLDVGFGDRHTSWGATVVHELGHVLGLDHVDAPDELMHRDPGFGPTVLGDGDLAGLRAVGADAGCRPAPPPRDVTVVPPATVSD